MKDFNRGGGSRFGGPKRFDNNRGPRQGDRPARPQMHSAVCSDCGNDCEVPFRPTGDKPIYCNSCFGKKQGFGDNNRFERREPRPSFNRDDRGDSRRPSAPANPDQYKQQFEMLNNKLDNILRLLAGKPATEKVVEKTVKVETLVVNADKKKADKKVEVKKVVAPKKAAKKVVAKKKK